MDLLQFPSFQFIFTFLLFMVMVLAILKKSKTNSSNSLSLPPGPWKLPLIGNLHQFIGSLPHHCLRDLAAKHGPIMYLKLGQVPYIVVSSADMAKQVLKTHDVVFASRPAPVILELMTYNYSSMAFAPYGEYWRQIRRICALELFSAKQVRKMADVRKKEVNRLVESISSKAGSEVNISEMLTSLAYTITSIIAFGGGTSDEKYVLILKKMLELGSGLTLPDLFPSIKLLYVMSGMRSTHEKLHNESDKIIERIISEHKESKRKTDDFVDVLLDLQENGNLGFQLTTNNIKAAIQDIFLGGSDTSPTTVVWAMTELLKNPQIMESAQKEVRQAFKSSGYVDALGLEDLKFLKLVIKETLRLHPPIPLLVPRESRERCEINGYEIPKKTRVLVNAWAIARDPESWEEPERFYPERFLDSGIDYKGNDFEYLPFGAGRRICPGITFGIANVELPLANLLYHFDWKLPNGMKLEDLDVTEKFGVVVGKKKELCLIPIPYNPDAAQV